MWSRSIPKVFLILKIFSIKILKPIDEIPGVADDEAIVFSINEKGGETSLIVETDEALAMRVFDEYYHMLEEDEANA